MTSNALLRAITFRVCCLGYAKTDCFPVTTLRSVGGIQAVDSCLQDKILSARLWAPDLAGNMAVSVPGDTWPGPWPTKLSLRRRQRLWCEKSQRISPDLIKLMITGGVLDAKVKGRAGGAENAPEMVKAACDQAHALGLPVAAHVKSPGVRVALEGGVDTIERRQAR